MVGTERHEIIALKPILELALKSEGKVVLYAGVIPQPFADRASR
jgi:hypothetical protein